MNNRGSDETQYEGRLGGTGQNAKPNNCDALLKKGTDEHRSTVRSLHGGHPQTTGKGNKA